MPWELSEIKWRKYMKKFISVFVAVVTALSFTGCGQTTTSENKNLEKVMLF